VVHRHQPGTRTTARHGAHPGVLVWERDGAASVCPAPGSTATRGPGQSPLSPQCITSHTRHLKINSSLQMPDRVLNFVKDHFLMDSPVRSQPLLLQSRLRYQQIGVHRVQGLRGTYDVLFLGTGGCSPGAGRHRGWAL